MLSIYNGIEVESGSDLDQLFSTVRAWLTLFNTPPQTSDRIQIYKNKPYHQLPHNQLLTSLGPQKTTWEKKGKRSVSDRVLQHEIGSCSRRVRIVVPYLPPPLGLEASGYPNVAALTVCLICSGNQSF